MSSNADEFIREIVHHPDDDAPRLVYADWLDERGDERGEFIRIQCRLESLGLRDPERPQLESRALRLVRRNSKGWAGKLRRHASRWEFRRGLVAAARVDAPTFLRHHEEILAHAPIREIDFRKSHESLENLASCPALSRLSGIAFRHNELGRGGPQAAWRLPYDNDWSTYHNRQASHLHQLRRRSLAPLKKLLESESVRELKSLNLDDNVVGDEGAKIVSEAAPEQLQSLSLRGSQITENGCSHIVKSKRLAKLRHIGLGGCINVSMNYDADTAGPFAEAAAPLIDRVESLDLSQCGITLESIVSFRDRTTERLTRLSLAGNMLQEKIYGDSSPTMKKAFSSSNLLYGVVELDFSSCYIDAPALNRLARSEGFSQLIKLNLNNNYLGEAGGVALAKLPLHDLTHLYLNGNRDSQYGPDGYQLGDAGVQSLLGSNHFHRLSVLSLRLQKLTSEVVRAFGDSAITSQLYHLDLSQNEIDDAGAELIARWDPSQRLALLNVRHNRISKPLRDQLRKRFGDRVIV